MIVAVLVLFLAVIIYPVSFAKDAAKVDDYAGYEMGSAAAAAAGDLDFDNDGIIDSLDNDDDNDGVPDSEDNDDDNGIPDELDTDVKSDGDLDDDGVPDSEDVDDDNDGVPDALDTDDDNDGIPDHLDEDDDGDDEELPDKDTD